MKLRLIILLTILTFPALANPQRTEKYVGYKHRGVVYGATLPNGVRDLGGGLLSDDDYGVTRFTKGRKDMLWLEKITGRDNKGVPMWQVKDVLTFEKLPKNQEFLFSYSSPCTQNGRVNLDLIVMAELSPNKRFYKVIKAWKANLKREKFESVAVRGIKCAVDAP
jgi:hypothetical protein